MIEAFSEWLSLTGPSLAIQNTAWAIPAAQSIHILALAVVLAAMAMLDLRLLGVGLRADTIEESAQRFIPPVWIALGVMAVTGTILILGEPARELLNPAFRWKMVLLVGAVIATVVVQRLSLRRDGYWRGRPTAARLIGVACLSLWLTIAVLGRWIAYVEGAG